jgi:hypothetical protein
MKSSKKIDENIHAGHRWTSLTVSIRVENCSPWVREQAGDFYDAGIKKLVPRLIKGIVIHSDYVKK